jgi:hypothetical protein
VEGIDACHLYLPFIEADFKSPLRIRGDEGKLRRAKAELVRAAAT